MKLTQEKDNIIIDQSKYAKHVTTRLENAFKNTIKPQDNPLPIKFTPTKADCPTNQAQALETKNRFKNLHFRSAIGSLLYMSCCTRPDICFAVNKLAKFSANPGVKHYRALLHLIGFVKNNTNKGLKFYKNIKDSPDFHMLKENNIIIKDNAVITFTDSSWNDCIDTGRSTGANLTMIQGGAVE